MEDTFRFFGLYQQDQSTLLARRGMQATGYPDAVMTTWSLTFQCVEQTNPAAAEVLCLCVVLAPDHIPLELLSEGADQWPPILHDAVIDSIRLKHVVEDLLRFSFVNMNKPSISVNEPCTFVSSMGDRDIQK